MVKSNLIQIIDNEVRDKSNLYPAKECNDISL